MTKDQEDRIFKKQEEIERLKMERNELEEKDAELYDRIRDLEEEIEDIEMEDEDEFDETLRPPEPTYRDFSKQDIGILVPQGDPFLNQEEMEEEDED